MIPDGFRKAILDDPENATNRLVLADYLDDQDTDESRARADLIRTQYSHDRTVIRTAHNGVLHYFPGREEEAARLEERQRDILARWAWKWIMEELPDRLTRDFERFTLDGFRRVLPHDEDADEPTTAIKFRRGFIEELIIPTISTWEDIGKEVVQKSPIRGVAPADRDPLSFHPMNRPATDAHANRYGLPGIPISQVCWYWQRFEDWMAEDAADRSWLLPADMFRLLPHTMIFTERLPDEIGTAFPAEEGDPLQLLYAYCDSKRDAEYAMSSAMIAWAREETTRRVS